LLKYNGLAIVPKTTKLIEGGYRGLQVKTFVVKNEDCLCLYNRI